MYIHTLKGFLKTLVLPVVSSNRINSGYHFVTVTLSNFTKLESLCILGYETDKCNTNFLKCFGKGMTNFVTNGGNLAHLEYYNLNFHYYLGNNENEVMQRLFIPFLKLKNIKSFHLGKTDMLYFS